MKDELEKLRRVKSKKRKRSTVNERTCNTEAVRSLHHYGWGAYKIPDTMGSRFTSDKPCDIIACSPKGRYVAIEGKMMKRLSSFSAKVLRPNQIFELDRATLKCKGRAFIFLYVRIQADKEKGIKRVHKLCVLDWKVHRKALLGKGYSKNQIMYQGVGLWLDAEKNKNGKTIYNLKRILSEKQFKGCTK